MQSYKMVLLVVLEYINDVGSDEGKKEASFNYRTQCLVLENYSVLYEHLVKCLPPIYPKKEADRES